MTLHTQLREIFEQQAYQHNGEYFYWEAKHAVALKKIITKIKFAYKNRGNSDPSEQQIKNAFVHVLYRSKQTHWVKDHFDIAIINMNWNTIIAKTNGNKTHQAAREFLNQTD